MAIVAFVQELLVAAVAEGGQRTARRNAWAALSADVARSRARHEAEVAMAQAQRRADTRRGTGS